MPKMNEEQYSDFTSAMEEIADNTEKLSDWERNFYEDQVSRHDEHGDEMFMSDKQLAVIDRMVKKIRGERT